MTRVLTLPGWQNSGPQHWQSLWEQLDATITRVEQRDWDQPDLPTWLACLQEHLRREPDVPTVLVGHSLGSLLAVHAASSAKCVIGALLVAPPDLADFPQLRTFTPVPRARLPFPAIVVGSRDDAFASFDYTCALATAWGARLVDAGARGHLNSSSNLGTWPEGRELLRELCAGAPFSVDARLARDTHLVGEGPLSQLRLMDDARFPWFVLVPRRSAVCELLELADDDRALLAREAEVLSQGISDVFKPDKLNVGALGNVVRQLHVHHVARRLGDAAWPGPVWGHSPRVPYSVEARAEVVSRLFSDATVARHFSQVSSER